MGIGTAQIIVILLLVLLFFGAKRLPEIARAMGKASLEFRKAREEMLGEPGPAETVEGGESPQNQIAATADRPAQAADSDGPERTDA